MKNEPTHKQLRAYFLVHIHGCTQREAAKIEGVSQVAISLRIAALRRKRPKLFATAEENIRLRNKINYSEYMSYRVIQRF